MKKIFLAITLLIITPSLFLGQKRAGPAPPDLPFIACTIDGQKNSEQGVKLKATLMDLPDLRPHTACVAGRSFARYVNSVHFDTATQEECDRRYAAESLNLIKKR